MNTSSLKSFAPAVRTQLMEAVGRKLDYVLTADTPDLRQAAGQVASLRREAGKNRSVLIERVAYTWFNRLAALRFLDAQGWHPFKARVLTPATPEETQPEILKLLRTGSLPAELNPHTDLQRLNDLLDGRLPTAIAGADPQGEAYRGLILAACRFYHTLLPDVFDKLNDESELLLPDDLLTATSVSEGFRTEITDADCLEADASGKSRANVEILGWLYQFYISEKKDAVMARKSAVPTEDIPAVTQLFTPHWIVRYLVENSLGRLWLLNRPNSRLRDHMPYYIEGEAETDFLKITKPEEIRLCDPAVGSGHMLTYAFDLLTLIYEEEGYTPSEIPALILRHNLHGLEICPRAAQLAELALVFKAREKSRRFFQPEHLVRPNITELQDIRFEEGELQAYFKALGRQPSALHPQLAKLLHQFEESKNFGSLIQPCLSEAEVQSVRLAIQNSTSIIQNSDLMVGATHLKVLRVLEQAEALTQRYHVVVANPPYLGNRRMSEPLKGWLESNYKAFKYDIFSAFIVRTKQLAMPGGQLGFMSPFVWMFISSYEDFRADILGSSAITSLVQLEYSGFDGATVPVCTFTIVNAPKPEYRGGFVRLSAFRGAENQAPRTLEAIRNPSCGWFFRATGADFRRVPGAPIAYWISERLRSVFEQSQPLSSIGDTRQGMATSDNGRFVRVWSEVSLNNTKFGVPTNAQSVASGARWFPYNKGGDYRKWHGNQTFVVNWKDGGKEILAHAASLYGSATRTIKSISEYFKPCISWSKISSSDIALRSFEAGFIFDVAGCCIFFKRESDRLLSLAFLNTKVAKELLKVTSPTLNFEAGQIAGLPLISLDASLLDTVSSRTSDLIALARADWDNFETSWDFRDQPLLRPELKGANLEASWRNLEAQSTAAIRRMKELETENNRLFIAAYGLDGELEPAVTEEQITLARADARRDMAAFLSYAVGCMMGRYSPDHPGLILANAGDTLENFRAKIVDGGLSMEDLSFTPDDDAIIPVLDGEWFEDDIVARTREFLRATFGEATLKQNLRFIEDSLGKSLDKYFLTDFYKDHLQTYKKRPIYWLFQSPKKGFSALVYVHRYTKDTVNTLLNKYLRDYLKKLEARIAHLVQVEATSTVTKEKNAARKEADKLKKALKDCQDWERNVILPLAQQRLEIDLDDGVKTNYLKFVGAVQAIAGLAAKED
jgi:type II restriction/modification system DNA methylase subunit YeeA